MTRGLRDNARVILWALAGVGTVAWLGLAGFAWSDYDTEVAPAFKALISGHVVGFLQLAPAYGGSLLLRAPFAAITGLLGGGELAVYRAVTLPCLLAAAALGVWLVARMRVLGVGRLARGTALALCVANPVTLRAIEIGHPEELLGGVLCVVAVLAALSGRATLAGLVLGVAIASKSWALVAVAPVLVALPAHRWRALLVAGAAAALILAPLVVAGFHHFVATNHGASATGTIFQPWQAWWFTGSLGHLIRGGDGLVKVGYRYPPGWLNAIPHPLIVALPVPMTLLWLRRRGAAANRQDLLLLLALVLLARCVLDPWNNIYYSLPFLLALLCWEALVLRAPPLLTLASSAAFWAIFQRLGQLVSPDVQSLVYLAWVLPLGVWLALRLYAPDMLARDVDLTGDRRRRVSRVASL
jgi:hypothetical protein